MNLWRIVYCHTGWRLVVSAVGGVAAGAALAAIMRLIHQTLTLPERGAAAAAWSFGGLIVVYFVGNVAAQHALSEAAERLQGRLRSKLLFQVLTSPLRRLERIGLVRLYGILSADIKTLTEYLCWLPEALVNLTIAVGCFAYMAWLSPAVFLFNLIFVALAAACYLLPERVAQRLGHRAAQANDVHLGQLHYALQGVRNLLLSEPKRADFLRRHFSASGAVLRQLNIEARLTHLIAERFAEVMVLGNVALLLFVVPRIVDLPVATATGILLAAIFARQPLKDSLDLLPRTQRANIATERMREAGLDPFSPENFDELPLTPHGNAMSELDLNEVVFRYESDHDQPGFLSGPFSLRIRAGEIVFIVGGNGAGKTTLAKLICGLYPPDGGSIKLDGVAITSDRERAALRSRCAAVFMDDPLFGHLLGLPPGAAEEQGRELLRTLGLEAKVGLDGSAFTTTDLSQGQRRRLVLLAALLEDRPIVLLDEWAADQDPQFREFFYCDLLPRLKASGKAVVVVTHDDRYFDRADRIVKIEQGRMAASA